MQEQQHTQFTSLVGPGQLWNEIGSSPIGYWFAPLCAIVGANKDNSDTERPWFERYEA